MKNILKTIVKNITKYFLEASNFSQKYFYEVNLLQNHDFPSDRLRQMIVINQWRDQFSKCQTPLSLEDVCFKLFSGNGQDGILLYLLTILGVKTHSIIDIGCGNGINGNAANLIINHGFKALLIDAHQSSFERGSRFYSKLPLIFNNPPTFLEAFLNRDNINEVIPKTFQCEIDILSIDIDSIDLYILDSIACFTPRIIVLEFNNTWGPADCKSVPYSDNFTREWVDGLLYGGASLAAFNKILKEKGYWLIGCDSSGFDAYFICEGSEIFSEVSVQSCYEKSKVWQATHSQLSQSRLKEKAWVDI